FPVIRVYKHLLGIPETYNERGEIVEAINWGFYGLICGMSFVALLTDYINGKLTNKIEFLLMPPMFLGGLISTSRSALLGVAGISFFIMAREFNHQARWKRAASL